MTSITDLFIKRPVLAIVVSLVILLAGYQSIRSLGVRQFPHMDRSVIEIMTSYPGAPADLVRSYVTAPIEKTIATTEGIDFIRSSSVQGDSIIEVHLKLNQDANISLTQIQVKLAEIRNQLPGKSELPSVRLKNADDKQASLYLNFICPKLNNAQITDFLNRVIVPRLSSIEGVQRAEILGEQPFAMRIWLKPEALASLDISASDINEALKANNYLATLGKTKGNMISFDLSANTSLNSVEEFKKLIIKHQNGTLVRLEDVADVTLGVEDYDFQITLDNQSVETIGIYCFPSANSLSVIKNVKATLPSLKRSLPSGMRLEVGYDNSRYIEDSIDEVVHTLGETLLIVVAVIFFFLGSWRSVLIPVIAIPISLIGAAFIMLLFGFTINLLTLLAIVLAVGLVVDDAIVVVENVERHLHEGKTAFEAAIQGARELVGPIIAMTITLAAVYTPIGFQGGLTGSLFREFAVSLSGAVVISGIVALTLSPMMASKLLRANEGDRGYAGWINYHFGRLQNGYRTLLEKMLHYKTALLIFATGWMLLIPFLYQWSPQELAPKEDQNVVFGLIDTPPNATLNQTLLYTKALDGSFFHLPEIEHHLEFIKVPEGMEIITMKPSSERKQSSDAIADLLNQRGNIVPGIQALFLTPPALPVGGKGTVNLVVCSTTTPDKMLAVADSILKAGRQSGMFRYLDATLKYDKPQVEIDFNRDKVADLGLNLEEVSGDLGALYGGSYVNRFSIQGQSYKVIPQIKRINQVDPNQLNNIYIRGPRNKLIELSTLATLKRSVQPDSLDRFQQLNAITLNGVLAAGVNLDEALKVLEDQANKVLPSGYLIDYQGEAREMRMEGSKFVETFLISLALIFLVLAAQFESFRDPLIILLGSVPLALAGSLFFTFLGFTTINIYSKVGMITLVGLVAKNGILIVEFANHLQREGVSQWNAILDASKIRLRPVMMTSVATIAGHFPLIFAQGAGSAARNSIGILLVSGMFIGTIFTLFILPAIYLLIARKKMK